MPTTVKHIFFEIRIRIICWFAVRPLSSRINSKYDFLVDLLLKRIRAELRNSVQEIPHPNPCPTSSFRRASPKEKDKLYKTSFELKSEFGLSIGLL